MRRALLWAVYAVYLAVLVHLVWSPEAGTASWGVTQLTAALNRVGVPITTTWVEIGLNVALFVPLSLLGTVLVPRLSVSDWVLVGFVGTLVVEVVQKLALPTRTGSTVDIVANTLGALAGAVLGRLLLGLVRARAARTARVAVAGTPGEAPA